MARSGEKRFYRERAYQQRMSEQAKARRRTPPPPPPPPTPPPPPPAVGDVPQAVGNRQAPVTNVEAALAPAPGAAEAAADEDEPPDGYISAFLTSSSPGVQLSHGKREVLLLDTDMLVQHCRGKSKLKFELRSYQQKVVNDLTIMSEANQQFIWLKKSRVVRKRRHATSLDKFFDIRSSYCWLRRLRRNEGLLKAQIKRNYHGQEQSEEVKQSPVYPSKLLSTMPNKEISSVVGSKTKEK